MKEDKRKKNGGARLRAGKKRLPAGEKKIQVSFAIKNKYFDFFKTEVQLIADKLNSDSDFFVEDELSGDI